MFSVLIKLVSIGVLLSSTVLNAEAQTHREAPHDFDGDGKSDFAVARLLPDTDDIACSGWMNCLASSHLQRIIWFNRGSANPMPKVVASSVAVIDGVHAYTLDPTHGAVGEDLVSLFRYDTDTELDRNDVMRLGSDNVVIYLSLDETSGFPVSKTLLKRQVESSLTVKDVAFKPMSDDWTVRQRLLLLAKIGGATTAPLGVYQASINNALYTVFAPSRESAIAVNRAQLRFPFGLPVVADYNGDGLDDLATWGLDDGNWTIRDLESARDMVIQWGLPGDHPMPGDYDGDREADIVVWRPSNGSWYVLTSSTRYDKRSAEVIQFGLPGDMPVRGDFDGDGRLDLAVFRPSNGTWYYRGSSSGMVVSVQWGLPGDLPVGLGVFDRYRLLPQWSHS